MPWGEKTQWEYVFNSDSSSIYPDFESFEEPLETHLCETWAEYKLEPNLISRESWCVDLFVGSYAVKILKATLPD